MEMASISKMTPVCDLQQVGILMQRNEHATTTKHENKIYGREVHKMVDKTLALSHRQIHPLRGSNKHG